MRKTALTAGGVALALALGACGDDQTGSDDDQGTATEFHSMKELVGAAEEGTDESQTANFSMEMEAEGMAVTATGEGRFTSEDPAMSMTMDLAGEEAEMRFVDNVMYVENPMAEMADGGSWMKFDPDDDNPLMQSLDGEFDEIAGNMDVSKTLEQMEAGGTITDSEETELDGEPARHYSIDFNMKEAMDEQGEAMGISGDEAEQIQEEMPETVPVELWLNEDQLPLQITMDMEEIVEAAGAPADDMEPMVMKYTDWGTDVEVEAPSDDDITDFGDLGGAGDIGDIEDGDLGDAGDIGDIEDGDLGDAGDIEDVLPN